MLPRRKPVTVSQIKTPAPLEQSLQAMDTTYELIQNRFENLDRRMDRIEDLLQQILNQVAWRP
jgi:hypothetical protein